MAPYLPRIIETCHVSPAPARSVPPASTSFPLTFLDMNWLEFPPIERLFFYPFNHSIPCFMFSYLPALKSSLSLALRPFLPLAGNIRLAPATTNKYEIYYAEGDSVVLTVAESDNHYVDDLFCDHPRKISMLKALAPRLSENESFNGLIIKPVLAIQVTLFPSRGTVIGTSVHHSACDGSGYVNFMCTWAAICRARISNSVAEETPVMRVDLDRSIIPDPDGSIYTAMLNALSGKRDSSTNCVQPSDDMFLASFKLKQEHIRFLKEALRCEAERRNVTVRCSTTVVTYAFAWVGYVKAKLNIYESSQSTEDVYSIFAVDHRQWFQPPIPESYFGNCIGPGIVQAKLNDLVGPDGFFTACQAIGRTFDETKRIGTQDAKDWLENGRKVVASTNLFGASGSVRFRVYEVDFGWGKPAKVDIVSISYTGGAMAVAQSRDHGGVEVGFCFTQHDTKAFANYFDEVLQSSNYVSIK